MTPTRAKALIRLNKFVNGMCLNVGEERPDVADMTVDEKRMLVGILETRSGNARMIDVLYDIANGRILAHMLAASLTHQLSKPNNGFSIA